MSIKKGRPPQTNFTIISNDILQNDKLSLAAKGLLLELLSRPPDWDVNVVQLTRETAKSLAIRTLLRELEREGYYTARKYSRDGVWHWDRVIHATPVPPKKRTWTPNKKEQAAAANPPKPKMPPRRGPRTT